MGLNPSSALPRSSVLVLGVLAIMALFSLPVAASGSGVSAATANDAQGKALAERLRSGGLILFFRHADTTGMHCDRSYRIGDRDGQRNLSPEGREQARRIGEALHAFGIPIEYPVRAGPVYRARNTAELAFKAGRVDVTDSLLADDYAGPRLAWVLAEHRRLFTEPVPAGTNRVLVGHRTPAIMVLGSTVGGQAFPEGADLVLKPSAPAPHLLGILALAPLPGRGFHDC
jgi:phosphohistidine phosphatase SixA